MNRYIRVRPLRVGDRVRVRPLSEILATLDEKGCLDALPFMPEMVASCGREFTVLKRVDKVNDLVDRTGLRRMKDAVILTGARCTGFYHGACRALCQTIWKEAWLCRVQEADSTADVRPAAGRGCSEAELLCWGHTHSAEGEERFRCQMTEIKNASSYLAWWDPRQYVRDLRSGNVTSGQMFRAFLFWIFSMMVHRAPGYRFLVGCYDRFQKLRGGRPFPYGSGRLEKTPTARLDLQPGEWVRVNSHEKILATLDTRNKNRGLWFDVEMVRYCGGTYQVLCRVDKIIEPKSGRMLRFGNPSIILDGVTSLGDYHRFYPQNEYPFWREIWLSRLTDAPRATMHDTQGVNF